MDKRNIEAIFPLSDLQAAFLFQGFNQERKDPGQLMIVLELEGALKQTAFSQAWQWLINRQPVLRTSVHWNNLPKPMQLVNKRCTFDVEYQYADNLDEAVSRQSLLRLDLHQAPLHQVTLFSGSGNRHILCWHCHHILLDGWSASIILQQVLGKYHQLADQLPFTATPVMPFQHWLKHIAKNDKDAARKFWLSEMESIIDGGSFYQTQEQQDEPNFEKIKLLIDNHTAVLFNQQIRQCQLTFSLLMQLFWALTLSELKSSKDVIFGITVSGRGGGPTGVENMLGMLANVVPVRLQVESDQSLIGLLQQLKSSNFERTPFEYVSLADLQRWQCLPPRRSLDSLLVVENFPFAEKQPGSLQITRFKGDFSSRFPLTLLAMPGDEIEIQLQFDNALIDLWQAKQILARLRQLINHFILSPELGLDELKQDALPFLCPKSSESAPESDRRINRTVEVEDDPLLDTLINLWREILGLEVVDVNESFFHAGGDSFRGLVFIDQINALMGTKLPLLALFQYPTIAELRRKIEQKFGFIPGTNAIPIREQGAKTPFFMIHGGSWMAGILAGHLDKEQPFYVLSGHWDDGKIGLNETIENLATDYRQQMLSIQKQGPWRIGGYSMGAVIAFEIAQQLVEIGETVELLFLLDPQFHQGIFKSVPTGFQNQQPCNDPSLENNAHVTWLDKCLMKYRGFLDLPWSEKLTAVKWRIQENYCFYSKRYKSRILQWVERLKIQTSYWLYLLGKPIPVSWREAYVRTAYQRACSRYELKFYNGGILIFSAEYFPENDIWGFLAQQENTYVQFDADHLAFTRSPELIHRWAAEFVKHLK